jgi:predicted transcriptional regulator
MEVYLKPDVQAKLIRLAQARGSNPDILASEAIEHFVDYDEWFVREVEKGLAQIDRGEVLSHAEVGERLNRLVNQK